MNDSPTTVTRPWPWHLWRQLSSIECRLLEELAYLARLQAKRSKSGAFYCVPGREYLAKKLGCSVVTVSRHVSRLKGLGLLSAFQRRPQEGQWQTNLYRLIHPLSWGVARIRHLVATTSYRVSRMTHLASSKKTKINSKPDNADFEALVGRWLGRGEAAKPSG